MNKLFRPHRLKSDSRGFTVIELMIATGVFAVVLLGITIAVLQISRVYYKGVVTTNTQNTTRQIMDIISQSVQFSGDSVIPTTPDGTAQPAGTNLAFCVGNKKYSYVLGRALYDGPRDDVNKRMPHVLVEQSSAADCAGTPTPYNMSSQTTLPGNSRELMSPNMRLTNLRVYSVGNNMYRITVRVVHGEADLLTNPDAENAACKGQQFGTQFCAISELSTVVTKRIGSTP